MAKRRRLVGGCTAIYKDGDCTVQNAASYARGYQDGWQRGLDSVALNDSLATAVPLFARIMIPADTSAEATERRQQSGAADPAVWIRCTEKGDLSFALICEYLCYGGVRMVSFFFNRVLQGFKYISDYGADNNQLVASFLSSSWSAAEEFALRSTHDLWALPSLATTCADAVRIGSALHKCYATVSNVLHSQPSLTEHPRFHWITNFESAKGRCFILGYIMKRREYVPVPENDDSIAGILCAARAFLYTQRTPSKPAHQFFTWLMTVKRRFEDSLVHNKHFFTNACDENDDCEDGQCIGRLPREHISIWHNFGLRVNPAFKKALDEDTRDLDDLFNPELLAQFVRQEETHLDSFAS
jgi:hypothetical protein